MSEDPHLLTIGQLAELLRVRVPVVWRLVHAGLLRPVAQGPGGEPLYTDADYGRLRLFVDLVDMGATATELRALATAAEEHETAADTAAALRGLLDELLARVQDRLDRLRALRADLAQARDALHRCRHCFRTTEDLNCRGCRAMPKPLPRVVDRFFCPPAGSSSGVVTSGPAPGPALAPAPGHEDPGEDSGDD
jgi:DNA-binding transcriptional MerR regulator